jgi:large conductance mechanosensitive channel protein
MIKDFKEFLLKQNALALAIGVIIGAAIGKVVSSIAEDVINPLIGPKPGEAKPATKECPQCKEIVPIAATRCKACTQPLPA